MRFARGIDLHPALARAILVVEIPIGNHGAGEVVIDVMGRTVGVAVNDVSTVLGGDFTGFLDCARAFFAKSMRSSTVMRSAIS